MAYEYQHKYHFLAMASEHKRKRVKYSPSQISKPINLDFFFSSNSHWGLEKKMHMFQYQRYNRLFCSCLCRATLFALELCCSKTPCPHLKQHCVEYGWFVILNCKSQLHQRHLIEGEEKIENIGLGLLYFYYSGEDKKREEIRKIHCICSAMEYASMRADQMFTNMLILSGIM